MRASDDIFVAMLLEVGRGECEAGSSSSGAASRELALIIASGEL